MISIKVSEKFTKKEKMSPMAVFSKPHGEVYELKSTQKRFCGRTIERPSYLVACGTNEGPMLIWWSDDDEAYQIAPAELEGYSDHVYVEKVECDINITLTVGGKNEA